MSAVTVIPDTDYELGGGWGDAINWSGTDQFKPQPLTTETTFQVHGWKSPRPKVGQTLKAEFEKSWIIFEFVEVELMRDPPDMFFAKVQPRQQFPK